MYLPQETELHNRYLIEAVIGHGGFGVTYLARDLRLDTRVAIKEFFPRQLATRGEGQIQVSIFTGDARKHFTYGLRKFLEEARSLAKFADHPNIVTTLDFFEENGTAYMVMEYLEGATLKEYLEHQGGRIPPDTAKQIMMPVLDALKRVHNAGLLHRDISPDNIYLTNSGQVKLLDFGAARYFAGEHSKSLSIILKPGYAPEEQYRSRGKQGAWTDVYAVAATFYRAIVGKTPPEALDRKEEDTLTPPSVLGVSLTPTEEWAIMKALAVNAGDRFQSIQEFQDAIQMGPVSWSPPPEPAYPRAEPPPAIFHPGALGTSQTKPPETFQPTPVYRTKAPVGLYVVLGIFFCMIVIIGLAWIIITQCNK